MIARIHLDDHEEEEEEEEEGRYLQLETRDITRLLRHLLGCCGAAAARAAALTGRILRWPLPSPTARATEITDVTRDRDMWHGARASDEGGPLQQC